MFFLCFSSVHSACPACWAQRAARPSCCQVREKRRSQNDELKLKAVKKTDVLSVSAAARDASLCLTTRERMTTSSPSLRATSSASWSWLARSGAGARSTAEREYSHSTSWRWWSPFQSRRREKLLNRRQQRPEKRKALVRQRKLLLF